MPPITRGPLLLRRFGCSGLNRAARRWRAGTVALRVRDAGFTLLELLVSMALLAVMFALVAAGLRFGAKAWEAGTERMGNLSETSAVQHFIRQRLTSVYPILSADEDDDFLFFVGTKERVEFATILPDHFGIGGFYKVTIGVSRQGQQTDLVFRHGLYRFDGSNETTQSTDRTSPLLENIDEARISYFGAPTDDEDPRWRASWQDMPTLPELIRVEVGFGEGDDRTWPLMVVAPVIEAP